MILHECRAFETSPLWNLVQGRQQIDPHELFSAVVEEVRAGHMLDVRTRMLIKESLEVLCSRWGCVDLRSKLAERKAPAHLGGIVGESFEKRGFPYLDARTMEIVKPQTALAFLRELGAATTAPASIEIGGAIALILEGLISRATQDIDIVNEVPESLRVQHALLKRLGERYGLALTHFQSHYLPDGWAMRTRDLGRFGRLDVRVVDALDIFIGKLFSRREKDLDDLRALAPQFERAKIEERLRSAALRMLGDLALRANAEKNWWIVFGAELPVTQ